MLCVANVVAVASIADRIADFPFGRGHIGFADGLANSDTSSGNGNGGSFNGNANCGNGFGNGFSSDGNGNGKDEGDPPAWCRFLRDLNGRLGLPPGTIPDFD
ncbi:MAG: hypothetical protein E5V61_25720 [Mesorhizobium sp.]|nr:MAG: hypothetical protein E5V61_25720 [Mesorhizobium sp.]